MKKVFVFLSIILLTFSCSNLEFVYKIDKKIESIKNKVAYSISGDDSDLIYSYLTRVFGPNKSEMAKYNLSLDIARYDIAQIIDKDATASKFSIKYEINYSLYNVKIECTIAKEKITTENSYESKSEGYSFGTDLSKKETADKTYQKNIDEFVASLSQLDNYNSCIK